MTDFIAAEAGIRQLLARYADSVWRKDFAAFGDCFTEDAVWKLGGRVIHGRAACAKFLEDVMPYFDRVLMTMGTPILDVGNDEATGRTYVTEFNARKDKRPAYSISTYYDRFVLQGDRWRLAWHHFQLHYIGPMDLSGRFFAATDYGAPFAMPGHDEPATPPESRDVFDAFFNVLRKPTPEGRTMHPKYPNVFRPIKIGPIEIKNRFYASPHVNPLTIANGGPSEDYIHYITARAKGGCGLVMVSLAAHERSRFVLPSPHQKESIPEFIKLRKSIHDADAKIFGELWYWWGAGGQWGPMSPPAPGYSPSAVQYNLFGMRSTTRAMSRDEIKKQIRTFGEFAANLREAGFDGIMIHAAHGAMAEHFLSPYFNRRTDEYGGSLENRMRFLIEVIQTVREAIGKDMALGMRLNCDELIEGGYHTKDAYQILKTIADMGVIDFADLDIAFEPDQYHLGMSPVFVPPLVYKPYVEAVRAAAGKVPVLSVLGRLTSIADGDKAIEAGVCDMVGAARALIAEPNLAKNAFDGNEDRSRACIACNWCMASLYYDAAQTCTINPAAWRERTWGDIPPAPKKSKVVVVGAGPAGLEAARVAAERGHDVTLYEARDKLGGALLLWSTLPSRSFYKRSIDWWEQELKRLGVKINLGKVATAAAVLAEKPDAVIVATGSLYSKQGHSNHRDVPIPGHDRDFVYRPEEILLGTAKPSGKVVILDGETLHTAAGIAEILANAGSDVEILTPMLAPVSPRVTSTQDAPFIMKNLRTLGVKLTITNWAKNIGDHEITAYDVYSEKEYTIKDVDAVVLCSGRLPVNDLERELDGKVAQLFAIGDAAAVRVWATASYEGHKFARYIGEPNAPASIADVYFSADFS